MNSYMIDIDLPKEVTAEFLSLIPKQKNLVSKLMKEGRISNYSLSYDRRKVWIVLNAQSAFEVKDTIRSFPIYTYIRYKVHNLLFHDSSSINTPQLWLN